MTNDLVDSSTLELMRQFSGEESAVSNYPFMPIITVSNEKVEKEVDGEKIDVLKKAEYLVKTKDGSDYITGSYAETFDGIILKVLYYASKKYNEADKSPYWRTKEFNSFGENLIEVIQDGEVEWKGTYNEFKKHFAEKYTLNARLYVAVSDEETVRLDLKGASRSNFWDYMKTFKKPDSISAHYTTFSVIKEKGPAFSYHVAKFNVNDDKKVDLAKVLQVQQEMSKRLAYGNQTEDDTVVEDVTVEDVPFK